MNARRRSRVGLDGLVSGYLSAKEWVIRTGFAPEIDWQADRTLGSVSESDFLREAAWVVLSSGMRELVVRQRFPAISVAFLHWESSRAIVAEGERCLEAGLQSFRHRPKLQAIRAIAEVVAEAGIDSVKSRLAREGIRFLQQFPFIGPVTAFHLAKNLGIDVVKPDRHLCRLAIAAGYSDPATLCADIAAVVGDRLAVIDLVLWRFATIKSDYCSLFQVQATCGRH